MSAGTEAPYSGAFVVVAGARDAEIVRLGSSRRMTYTVESSYPPTDVLSEIMGKLCAMGWEPLPEDFMNPGLPTSRVKGWDKFLDKGHSPATRVYRWSADWKNGHNEVVRYVLTYEYPAGREDDMKNLRVMSEYYPSSIVEKLTSQTN